MRNETNPLDDSRTVTLALPADSGASSFGQTVGLILRCQSNRTVAYINWNDYLGSEANVTWRIGQGQAQTAEWDLSTDSQATFFPNGHIEFIKDLLEVDRLVAQVTPYNEDPVTAVFDLTGLAGAIGPLREACRWADEALARSQ